MSTFTLKCNLHYLGHLSRFTEEFDEFTKHNMDGIQIIPVDDSGKGVFMAATDGQHLGAYFQADAIHEGLPPKGINIRWLKQLEKPAKDGCNLHIVKTAKGRSVYLDIDKYKEFDWFDIFRHDEDEVNFPDVFRLITDFEIGKFERGLTKPLSPRLLSHLIPYGNSDSFVDGLVKEMFIFWELPDNNDCVLVTMPNNRDFLALIMKMHTDNYAEEALTPNPPWLSKIPTQRVG